LDDKESSLHLKIESLHTISKLAAYPNTVVGKYSARIMKTLKPLLDDKKRLVRKFARNCINEWECMS